MPLENKGAKRWHLKSGRSQAEREKHRDILRETDRRGRDGRKQRGQRGREREPTKERKEKRPVRAKGAEGTRGGISLAVQWLRFRHLMQGVQVRSLVKEPTSHMPGDQKKEEKKMRRERRRAGKERQEHLALKVARRKAFTRTA